MADRKISELTTASRVHDADFMVVVTGVGQLVPGQSDIFVDKITTKFPLSGLSTWVFRINEVVSGVSGIRVIPTIGTGNNPARPNSVLLSTTGVSFVGHTHTSSDITNFTTAVTNIVEQTIKYTNNDVSNTVASELTPLSGQNLFINLAADTRYICELGLIMSGNASNISGVVSSTGIAASNTNLLSVRGTWNYVSGNGLYNSSNSVTGISLISHALNGISTLVTKFSIKTYETIGDQINISFTSNNTDAKVLQGSWLKAEKVI